MLFKADLHQSLGDRPKVGDVVTFEYETKAYKIGNPVNAKIVRIRTDLNWDNVIDSAAEEQSETGMSIHLFKCLMFHSSP